MPAPPLKSPHAASGTFGLILSFFFVAQGLLAVGSAHAQVGHVLNGEGALNQAVAGVAAGMPVGGSDGIQPQFELSQLAPTLGKQMDRSWHFAAPDKSEQSFQAFKFNSVEANGAYRRLSFDLDGSETGSARNSIFFASMGAEFKVREDLFLSAGYALNQNLITDKNTNFNIQIPAIIQHHGSIGLSWKIADAWYFDLAYSHGSEDSTSGQVTISSVGSIPDTEVESWNSAQSLLLGLRVEF